MTCVDRALAAPPPPTAAPPPAPLSSPTSTGGSGGGIDGARNGEDEGGEEDASMSVFNRFKLGGLRRVDLVFWTFGLVFCIVYFWFFVA